MGDFDNGSGVNFPVCETVSKVADSILKHFFAIYRVDKETANDIDAAWQQARRFFDKTPQKTCFHRLVNGHLHGFHIPSEAKFLYRVFCGSALQPWPNREFQNASEMVADKLHRLLLECYDALVRKSVAIDGKMPRKKRKRSNPFNIPESSKESDACPLDYFLYHGGKPNIVSCSEHIDRGVLICVCLTNVPGLEVLPRDHHEYFCPEVETHNRNLYRDREACSGLVCIMAGDQLKQTHPEVTACAHRVRNDLKEARLSITYEVRAAPMSDNDI